MVDIASGLSAIMNGMKILKELNVTHHQIDEVTFNLKVAQLSSDLASAQIVLSEAQQELTAKDKEIDTLKAGFAETARLVERNGYRYRKRASGEPQGRPYCPRCYAHGRLFMLVNTHDPGRPLLCPDCDHRYYGVTYYAFEGGGT